MTCVNIDSVHNNRLGEFAVEHDVIKNLHECFETESECTLNDLMHKSDK